MRRVLEQISREEPIHPPMITLRGRVANSIEVP